jgi:ribosomal protein S18 acetylase RimI-like enzyme
MKAAPTVIIRSYEESDEKAVTALWRACDLLRPWNNPERDIARKLKVNRELFLIGMVEGKIIASVMGGYEGHRGWVNYLAVDPAYRKKGIGRKMMLEIESKLRAFGCPKVNLQVRAGNTETMAFYEKIGYGNDNVTSYGKRLIRDD